MIYMHLVYQVNNLIVINQLFM